MVKKAEDRDTKIKLLEDKIKNIEAFHFKKVGRITFLTGVGILFFYLSLNLFSLISPNSGILSYLGTVGAVLVISGLIFFLTSFTIQPMEKKQSAINKLDLTERERAPMKEITRPKKEKNVYTADFTPLKEYLAKYMPKKKKEDLEANIGIKWFSRIGIISLVVGIIYFLKYAFDNDWIGPIGRIVIGVVAGLILIMAGEFFDKKKYILYARTLTGGGFAVLYGSMYAAHNFYNLVSLFTDIVLLSIVVVLGVIFAIKYNSPTISSLAFLLGYATAYLTGTGKIHTIIYTTILTLGLLILVYKKSWIALGIGGAIATYLIHFIWLRHNPEEHLTHLVFLTIYLMMFGLMSLQAGKYIKAKDEKELGAITKIAASFIFLLSFIFTFISRPSSFDYLIFYSLLAICLFFVALKNKWIGVGVGGAFATYLSFMAWYTTNANNPSRFIYTLVFLSFYFLLYASLGFFIGRTETKSAIAGKVVMILLNSFFYFSITFYEIKKNYDNLTGLFTLGIAVLHLLLTYIAYRKKIKSLFITYLALTISYLTLTIPLQLNDELITLAWAVESVALVFLGVRFNNRILRIFGYIVGGITTVKTLFIDSRTLQPFDIHNILGSTRVYVFLATIIGWYYISYLLYKNKSILKKEEWSVPAAFGVIGTALTTVMLFLEGKDWSSLWWAVQAFILMLVAFKFGKKELRYSAYILGVLVTIKLLMFDGYLREFERGDIVGSVRFFVYLAAIILFYSSARIGEHNNQLDNKEKKYVSISYNSAGTLLAAVLLFLEFKNEWVSVVWAIYAILLLVVGFGFKKWIFRLLGIVLLGVTILKVFIFDFQELELFFRIISFIGLGILLLVAAFMYNKYKERIKRSLI